MAKQRFAFIFNSIQEPWSMSTMVQYQDLIEGPNKIAIIIQFFNP